MGLKATTQRDNTVTMDELIEALGGPTAVANALGIKNSAVVGNWKKRGVSWKWRAAIAELARQKAVPVPPNFLRPTLDDEAA